MKGAITYIGAVAGIVLAVLSIVYGAILPFKRSQAFIRAISSVSSVHSYEEFRTLFDGVFNFYAPVGDEEIAKYLESDVAGLIADPNQPEALAHTLVAYIEPHIFKNDVRHLLAMGQMYATLWRRFGKPEDFATAENYYLEALKIGPKLPPALYSLISLYNDGGQLEKTKALAETILLYWPQDENIRVALTALNSILVSPKTATER